ncbi:hypothetical protein [Constrictibacter sp. MBR-5]|jgi:hypothetical protein|uniref:hypothetical protein n=1 Tax=Constrictibacter sp. MBR-5 TaxID=3156467 RepID=UPI0033997624
MVLTGLQCIGSWRIINGDIWDRAYLDPPGKARFVIRRYWCSLQEIIAPEGRLPVSGL